MNVHLRPETQERLAAQSAALGMSVDAYLEALVEKQLPPAPPEAEPVAGSQFQKEHGIWVYRTGDPMPPTLADETLDALRREREASPIGNIPR
jgi:hypothetical protein